MALTPEQIKFFKEQIFKQLESWPEDQRKSAKEQIEEMNDEEFEQFLIKNKMIKANGEVEEAGTGEEGEKKQECVFCSIIQGKIPSYKLAESKSSLAILEINPLSPGHSIVLSKDHNKLPSSTFILANKLGKRIKSKLKAQEIKIENSQIMGHQLVNIIPIYKDKKLEKKKADEKELILMQDKIQLKPGEKKEKPQLTTSSSLPKAPRRIP